MTQPPLSSIAKTTPKNYTHDRPHPPRAGYRAAPPLTEATVGPWGTWCHSSRGWLDNEQETL